MPLVSSYFCQLAILTTNRFGQLAICSAYHLLNLPFAQLAICSTYHLLNLPFAPLAIISTCFYINLPLVSSYLCWLAILTSNQFGQLAILSFYHFTNTPISQLAILPSYCLVNFYITPIQTSAFLFNLMIKPFTLTTMTWIIFLANIVNFRTKTWPNFSKMIKALIYLNITLGPVLTIGPGPNIDFNWTVSHSL